MALINCRFCGKEVSDKAKFCPACGAALIAEAERETPTLVCQECGANIPADAAACPNCGCPIEEAVNVEAEADVEAGADVEAEADAEAEGNIEESAQSGETAAAALPKAQPKKKGRILAIIAILAVIIGSIAGIKAYQDRQAAKAIEAYESNMLLAANSMLDSAIKAENTGNLIHDVWYNAIYQEPDSATDKFTRPDGAFVSDFNTALANLFGDSEYIDTINGLKEDQELIGSCMNELQETPEGYDEVYAAVKECYDSYKAFTDLVIEPSGSLNSFTSAFSEADADLAEKLGVMRSYFE